jgi:hypothetical protein
VVLAVRQRDVAGEVAAVAAGSVPQSCARRQVRFAGRLRVLSVRQAEHHEAGRILSTRSEARRTSPRLRARTQDPPRFMVFSLTH